MRAILAMAGVVLLTALVVLGVRGGGDAGDPTALDTPTETGPPTDGSTAAGGDSDPVDPTEGSDEVTPSPTDDPVTDDETDATGDDATEPGDGDATGSSGDGDDGDSGDAEPAGSQSGDDASGEGSSGAGSGDDGSAADDVDDMPDTGAATALPLAGLVLAGLALRLRR